MYRMPPKLSVTEIRRLLDIKGLPTTGLKVELTARLEDANMEEAELKALTVKDLGVSPDHVRSNPINHAQPTHICAGEVEAE